MERNMLSSGLVLWQLDFEYVSDVARSSVNCPDRRHDQMLATKGPKGIDSPAHAKVKALGGNISNSGRL